VNCLKDYSGLQRKGPGKEVIANQDKWTFLAGETLAGVSQFRDMNLKKGGHYEERNYYRLYLFSIPFLYG
jgi:hypothetical protein